MVGIIRIIAFLLLGAGLMFYVQPFLLNKSGIILLTDDFSGKWTKEEYLVSAFFVFLMSAFTTFLWFFLTRKVRVYNVSDLLRVRLTWWLLFPIPLLTATFVLVFFDASNDVLLSLVGLFSLDILLLFWLPTALSSWESVKYIPPGSFFIRRLLNLLS